VFRADAGKLDSQRETGKTGTEKPRPEWIQAGKLLFFNQCRKD
jgi:hypothetical protein